MKRRYTNLAIILVLAAVAVYIILPGDPLNLGKLVKRDLNPVLGLDLRGGMQVILGVPEGFEVTTQNLQDAVQILENRTNALGVAEKRFQIAGERNIVGEFPGQTDSEQITANIKQVGQLEFVDFGTNPPPDGTIIETDFGLAANAPEPTPGPDGVVPQRYHTVMTGTELRSVGVTQDELGRYMVAFELTSEGSRIFREFTTANVGRFLGIVLDKRVVSSPRIDDPITEGSGVISGQFDRQSANALAVNLRYGSLPVPLEVEQSRLVSATLGEDSLNKSLLAGAIGFAIVMLFMGIFYRIPGIVADIAMLFFAVLAFALFILIPVTMTLPGIAGFLLSTGAALDANILIFERMKEELRNGRSLKQGIDIGWRRAWPSIRDSNIAALITSAILFWFGSTFGASIVQGFALTLALGVLVSLFSAIVVTRTLLSIVLDLIRNPEEKLTWFGI